MITNEEIKSLLKDLRAIESNSEFSVDQYAEIYEGIDSAMKCLEEKKKEIKKVLSEKLEVGQTIALSEKKKEILLHEGKQTLVYNSEGIHEYLGKEGLGEHFYKIVNVVQSRVKDLDDSIADIVTEAIGQNSTKVTGKPYVTIQKLKG